ncbi:MAG: flagellin [Sulfurimonas sp.]|jgi:flagellin-like hook-associated protein FlgL
MRFKINTNISAMSALDTKFKGINILDASHKGGDFVFHVGVNSGDTATVSLGAKSMMQRHMDATTQSLRDVDFAAESANFAKDTILVQSGSYVISQANATQQNVMRLLR